MTRKLDINEFKEPMDSLKREETPSLREYLNKVPNQLFSIYSLSNCGNLYFHWADWEKSGQYEQNLMLSEFVDPYEKETNNQSLEYLRQTPIWLREKGDVKQISLFDMYKLYLDAKVRGSWYAGNPVDYLYSSMGADGPFEPIVTMGWFSSVDLQRLVFSEVIGGNLPKRKFRVRSSEPIVCYFGRKCRDKAFVRVRQFHDRGMILSTNDSQVIDQIKGSEAIRFGIDFDWIKMMKEASMDEIKEYATLRPNRLFYTEDPEFITEVRCKRISFSPVYPVNYSKMEMKIYYFFVPYDAMLFKKDKNMASDAMKTFVDNLENIFQHSLEHRNR